MLQFITGLPDDVIGIRATGDVDMDDYKRVLIPRLEEMTKRQGEVSYLLVLETDVQNFSTAAWWTDFKLSLKNFTKWKKVAIVTDQAGVEWFFDVAKHFMPGESRGYKLEELDEALEWISKKDEEPEHEEIGVNELKETNHTRASNKGQGPSGENL